MDDPKNKLGPYYKEILAGHEHGMKDQGYVRDLERRRKIAALKKQQ